MVSGPVKAVDDDESVVFGLVGEAFGGDASSHRLIGFRGIEDHSSHASLPIDRCSVRTMSPRSPIDQRTVSTSAADARRPASIGCAKRMLEAASDGQASAQVAALPDRSSFARDAYYTVMGAGLELAIQAGPALVPDLTMGGISQFLLRGSHRFRGRLAARRRMRVQCSCGRRSDPGRPRPCRETLDAWAGYPVSQWLTATHWRRVPRSRSTPSTSSRVWPCRSSIWVTSF